MKSRPCSLVSTLIAAVFLATALALPAAGARAQATSAPLGPGSYKQDSPPSGNAAMTPLAAPQPKPKPKGGCLKYGAAGAVGGHLAHHHAVLGAMGGCTAGMYVKHRSKKSIAATGQP